MGEETPNFPTVTWTHGLCILKQVVPLTHPDSSSVCHMTRSYEEMEETTLFRRRRAIQVIPQCYRVCLSLFSPSKVSS